MYWQLVASYCTVNSTDFFYSVTYFKLVLMTKSFLFVTLGNYIVVVYIYIEHFRYLQPHIIRPKMHESVRNAT